MLLFGKAIIKEGVSFLHQAELLLIYIYIYILSKAHSKRCFKNSIDTQRKTLLVNVSA